MIIIIDSSLKSLKRFSFYYKVYCVCKLNLMDWSCCFCRASSERGEKEPWVPLMGVFGADLFFWSEWSSSIVWALTGGVLSSWHIALCFFCEAAVWIFASPFLAVPFPKLNSPLPFAAISHDSSLRIRDGLSEYVYNTRSLKNQAKFQKKQITLIILDKHDLF